MIILEQTTDLAGKIRMTCELSNGETIALKFDHSPSNEELNTIEFNYIAQHAYDHVEHEIVSIYDHANTIRDFIAKVKATPSITLTQYNTWLTSKYWGDVAVIRFFVYKLASAIAIKKGYTLSNYSESAVLSYLRTWIVATPTAEIMKTVFNSEI